MRPVVAVTSGPAELLAAAVLGSTRVERIAPEGASLLTWRPGDASLDAMVSARRVLVLGDEAEPWLQRAGLPPSRTLRLDAAVPESRWIEVGSVTHTHGGGESHTHGGVVGRRPGRTPTCCGAMAAAERRRQLRRRHGWRAGAAAPAEAPAEAPGEALGARIDAYAAELGALAASAGRARADRDAPRDGVPVPRRRGIRLEVTELELGRGRGAPAQ